MDKGRVFVFDTGGVTAYDEVTGDQMWRRTITRTFATNNGKLVVSGGKVVVAFNFGSAPSGGTGLAILDAATGASLGSATNNNGNVDTLLVDRGVVVISGESRWDADTFAFSLSDGKPLWTTDYELYQPVSANGRILVRGWKDNVQYSRILDIRTGQVLVTNAWKFYNVLAANDAGTQFYVAWGHSLQVIDAATGKPTWLASRVYPKYAAVSPTRLYVATTDHRMIAFDAGTGAKAWTKTYPNDLLPPIVAGGVLYATVLGDRMYALNPVDGAALPTPALTGAVQPPVVTNGKLYLTDGAKLFVYGR
jgi:outer membrane protein assembly factor BamB